MGVPVPIIESVEMWPDFVDVVFRSEVDLNGFAVVTDLALEYRMVDGDPTNLEVVE